MNLYQLVKEEQYTLDRLPVYYKAARNYLLYKPNHIYGLQIN